jgi:hypothetical protein
MIQVKRASNGAGAHAVIIVGHFTRSKYHRPHFQTTDLQQYSLVISVES